MIDQCDQWSATRNADGVVVLRRRVECVVCCKRKRHECGVCGGTGIRTVDHAMSDGEAHRILQELQQAIHPRG